MILSKYVPSSVKDIIGQDEAVVSLAAYIQSYKSQKKRAVLLFGPPGVGKSAAVYALARDLDLEVLEVNASDKRNKDSLLQLVGESGKQHSLFSRGKIIFVDELEGISGNADRGGMQALLEILPEMKFPVVFATNDPDLEKLETLKSKCELIEFSRVPCQCIADFLQKVCLAEGIVADGSLLKQIARNVDGDVRAALLDLEVLSVDNVVVPEFFDVLGRASREAVHDTVVKVLKGSSFSLANDALMHADVDVVDLSRKRIAPILFAKESCIRFGVEENLPYQYLREDLGRAFSRLSSADVFHGRIARWQYYRYLVYVQAMVAAVAIEKSAKSDVPFEFRGSRRSPKYNKGLWFMLNKRREIVVGKIAAVSHSSPRRINQDIFLYRLMLRNTLSPSMVEELGFDEKDVAWLKK